MVHVFKKSAVLFVSLFVSGCDHFGDTFTARSKPLKTDSSGLLFYDRWRAQSGINIANSEDQKTCRFFEMNGKTLIEIPGRFCVVLPDRALFILTDKARAWEAPDQLRWEYTPQGRVKDVRINPLGDSVCLLTNQKENSRVTCLATATGVDYFAWEGPASETPSPFREDQQTQNLPAGHILSRRVPFVERSQDGRLVWQWAPQQPFSGGLTRLYKESDLKFLESWAQNKK